MTEKPSAPAPAMASDAFAAVYESSAHRITGPISVRALDLSEVEPGQRIVDIAAGAGALSGPAAERGLRVIATDAAPGMVRRLAERLRPFTGCEAAVMDGQALDLADESVDAAYCVFGTIFFPDWRAGLREQARVVKPGGTGCAATWRDPPGGGPFAMMAEAMAEVLGPTALPSPPGGMVALAEPTKLAEAMTDAGFERVEVTAVEGVWIGRGGDHYLADNAQLHGFMPGYADLGTEERGKVDAVIRRLVDRRTRNGLVAFTSIANLGVGMKA